MPVEERGRAASFDEKADNSGDPYIPLYGPAILFHDISKDAPYIQGPNVTIGPEFNATTHPNIPFQRISVEAMSGARPVEGAQLSWCVAPSSDTKLDELLWHQDE